MTKNKVLSSSFWTLGVGIVDRCAAFIVYIVLARYLEIEEFGAVAFSILFIEFLVLIINSGVKELIVSKDSINSKFVNTCFYAVMSSAFLLVIIFYLLIDTFFSNKSDLIVDVIKALSFLPFIASLNIIQTALLQRSFLFKSLSLRSLFSTILAGVIGVLMAHHGYGVWALILNKYVKVAIDTIFMLYITKYIPAFEFSVADFKNVYRFGIPLLLSEALNFWSSRVVEIFVSSFYGIINFGLLDVGRKFNKMLNQTTLTPLRAVCLSYVSQSENKGRSFARFSCFISLLVMPASIFIGFYAEPLVLTFLGEKWVLAIPICQAFAFTSLAQCLSWYFPIPLICCHLTKDVFFINLLFFIFSLIVGFISTFYLDFYSYVAVQIAVVNLGAFYKIYYLWSKKIVSLLDMREYFFPVIVVATVSVVTCYLSYKFTCVFFSADFSLINIFLFIMSYAFVFIVNLMLILLFFKKIFYEAKKIIKK